MKTLFTGIFAALALLCGFSIAQDTTTPAAKSPAAPQAQQNPTPTQSAPASSPQAASTPAGANSKIAPGSVLPVQLTKSIDAKKIKTGDAVEAEDHARHEGRQRRSDRPKRYQGGGTRYRGAGTQ